MSYDKKKAYMAARFDVQILEMSETPIDMAVRLIAADEIEALKPISLVRDGDTARVISDELGFEIKAGAHDIQIGRGDTVIVPIFVAGLNADDTISFPYVAIDHFIAVEIAPF